MLMLSRRVGESIVIGENVRVCIVSIAGNQIKVGVDAPRDISVHREEVFKRVQAERGAGRVVRGPSRQPA